MLGERIAHRHVGVPGDASYHESLFDGFDFDGRAEVNVTGMATPHSARLRHRGYGMAVPALAGSFDPTQTHIPHPIAELSMPL